MGRPMKDVESHKEFILSLYNQDTEYKEILHALSTQRDFYISDSLLRKNLLVWSKTRYNRPECRDENLRKSLIAVLFFEQNLDDEEILVVLKTENLTTAPGKLQRLRLEKGMRRQRSRKNARSQDEEILRVIQEHLDKGVIGGYGLNHLYTYFRRNGIIISRDDLIYGMRIVDPEGVERRYREKQRGLPFSRSHHRKCSDFTNFLSSESRIETRHGYSN